MLDIIKEANEIKDMFIKWRHDLHQIPEIGLNLTKTSSYIQEKLKDMNINYQVIAKGSSVIAVIGEGSPCLLLRSDMDALPIKEEANIEFASQNGYMHACGHDMHAANLLGAAYLLKKHENKLKGTVKLLFQAGEEIFEGAKACLEDGILDNPQVDSAFAIHVNSMMPTNVFAYGDHPMSSVYSFEIRLKGVGGHGSTPEVCVDPINTGVHIYLALQELIAREIAPRDEVALTIGRFNAGDVSNIIPDTAILSGTLRTFDTAIQEKMIERIHDIVKGICLTYRTEYEIITLGKCPSVICNEEFSHEVIEIIKEMNLNVLESKDSLESMMKEAYINKETFYISNQFKAMASEDFGFISSKVPSGYYLLGAAMNDKKLYNQHHPKVEFNDDALPIGASIYASVAIRYLENHQN